ncbi:radical SAM family heme chaperone HemW [Rhodovulum sulfidophilum]|uniref:Heme chaperone HemW n=1 Tax=Rhodovulum sulfidophilum TaxID=35806 RepID=A0ABS1RMG6_RHOSU|nr:radical SAM family heme chaperone HemW [Rhodovulum sulfidophilum]MBL3607249.1 coproporphyrinogen III oxidase [Rhodovulum sulfidophilum]MCE8455091.1 radical SAM family heme chaperone HemW [Rhodovulum sulfidophilum]
MSAEDWQEGGFGLYVHWPFCLSKCPYCDFNSHVSAEIDTARWQEAYLSEIRRLGAEVGPRVLNTVFFGGGTPSLMPPELVGAILDTARSVWTPANDIEVTLEANPTSVEAGRFTGFAEAGVNRVSLGIQALNDADLRRLGRTHSVAEARAAFDIARSRFPRVSFDLIYARQSQSLAAWRDELGEALAMAVDHLSLYQLTVEAGTAFGDRLARGGLKGLPDEDLGADLYELTQELCETAGMPAYEISNHARPGAESRHNLIYWQAGDYAGIGPGAHGRLTLGGRRTATDTPLPPMSWLERVERQGTGDLSRSTVAPADQGAEYLMMGLRLVQGLSLRRYERIANSQIDGSKITELSDLGLIETEADHLRTTAAGRAVLNAVIRALLPD